MVIAGVKLPTESQQRLILTARRALEGIVNRRPYRAGPCDDPLLKSVRYGAFVTLFNQDELRGCVGTCRPSVSLQDTVIEMTEAAATRDHRVGPVHAAELPQICIDISVLSPLTQVSDPLALEVGRHGLHLACGRKRAVLLPQVAVEYDWDMKTFLEQTCLKADLPTDAWTWPQTRVSGFTALVIEEKR